MSSSLLVFGGIGAVGVLTALVVVARGYRRRAVSWEMLANLWFNRAVAMGWDNFEPQSDKTASTCLRSYPPLTNEQASRLLRDLFPESRKFARPMGVPSTTADVDAARFWREQRALSSRDHITRHGIDDVPNEPRNDSWAAHEILRFVEEA